MKSKKWRVLKVNLYKTEISDERFEQTFAEVAEIIYKKICQQVQVNSISTEPPINQLVETQFKKAASE
ncbi:MAG: hypothetical protein IPM97_02445 [Bdellovibrionaceae bacterium]|nr:hypothetical protein [Pseudobdellovibrionaceae bacterium]